MRRTLRTTCLLRTGPLLVVLAVAPLRAQHSAPPTQQRSTEQVEQTDREEHETMLRNTPPLRLGLWEETQTDPALSSSDRESLCNLQDISFLFRIRLSKQSKGVGSAGIRFNFSKVSDRQFLATTQVITPGLGLAKAEHHVLFKGPESFTDHVIVTEGGHRSAQYTLEGRWLKECPQ